MIPKSTLHLRSGSNVDNSKPAFIYETMTFFTSYFCNNTLPATSL